LTRVLDRSAEAIRELMLRSGGGNLADQVAVPGAKACALFWNHEFPIGEGWGETQYVDVSGSDLTGGMFFAYPADVLCLRHARFGGARLDGTRWFYCQLGGADFAGASLRNCLMFGVIAPGACFHGADLTGSRIGYMALNVKDDPIDFTGANLSGADIMLTEQRFVLTGAKMAGSRIREGAKATEAERQAYKALVDDFLANLSADQRAEMARQEQIVTPSTVMPAGGPAVQRALSASGVPVSTDVRPCHRCKKPILRTGAFLELCEQAGLVVDSGTGEAKARMGGFTVVGNVLDAQACLDEQKRTQQQSLESLEDRKGFRCVRCGAIYCMACLFRYAPPHHKGGKACPDCGGTFVMIE